MEFSFDNINDLPDEIILIILKKLSNIQVLDSLFGVNQRLNSIAQDSIFTRHLTLFECSTDLEDSPSNDDINPLSDSIINRFCLEILPVIRHKIEWLDVESTCLERALLATKYPNLIGLGVYKIDIDSVTSLFTNENIFDELRNQIVSLAMNIHANRFQWKSSTKGYIIRSLFAHVLKMFTNLQCLKLHLDSYWNQDLFLNYSFRSVCSLSLLELYVDVYSFYDCLYLLNGRFPHLRTLHVHCRTIEVRHSITVNQKKLPHLKCFSLYCGRLIHSYDELVVPLLHRMVNLEKLDLRLIIYRSRDRGLVHGNDLKETIMKYMAQLKEFTFDICTSSEYIDRPNSVLSTEDVQKMFIGFPAKHVIAWTDNSKREGSQCYIHSYPYRMRQYDNITNQFSGGLFRCVSSVSLYDERPFEREFFVKIAKSFPMMRDLVIHNRKAQENKRRKKVTNNNQDISIIQYPHLESIDFLFAHNDYVEQFLFDTEVCFPKNTELLVDFKSLTIVTHNFQRDETRVNCAKMIYWLTDVTIELPEHVQNYFCRIIRDPCV